MFGVTKQNCFNHLAIQIQDINIGSKDFLYFEKPSNHSLLKENGRLKANLQKTHFLDYARQGIITFGN